VWWRIGSEGEMIVCAVRREIKNARESEVVVITHTDLDGLSSAALILRYAGCIDRFYFAQPHQLYAVLNKVPNKAYVYIADLGVNAPTLPKVIKHIQRIVMSGGRVKWFDHHVWDKEWVARIRNAGVDLYIDRNTCAAGVVAKYLGLEGKDVETLVRATCSVDLWRFDSWLGNYLARYAGYRGGQDWKKHVVIKLSTFNGILDDEIKNIVEKAVSNELKVFSKAINRAVPAKVGNIKIVAYFKGNEEHLTSYVANILLSRFQADIAVIVRYSSVSFRSRTYNVRELAKALGGGGHPQAAGAPLKPPFYIRLLTLLGIKRFHLNWCIKRILEVIKSYS